MCKEVICNMRDAMVVVYIPYTLPMHLLVCVINSEKPRGCIRILVQEEGCLRGALVSWIAAVSYFLVGGSWELVVSCGVPAVERYDY